MKKSNFLLERLPFYKMGFLSFLLTFLFVAAMHSNTEAQVSPYINGIPSVPQGSSNLKALYIVPTGNFASVDEAQVRLTNAITALKEQLIQNPPGSAAYEAANRRAIYYATILTNIRSGMGVAESIAQSLGRLMVADAPPPLPTAEQALVEKNAAISLLS